MEDERQNEHKLQGQGFKTYWTRGSFPSPQAGDGIPEWQERQEAACRDLELGKNFFVI